MSGLSLLAPLGLIALVGIPLVILYHMRHTTPTVRPVPTLRFWLAAMEQQTEQVRFRRPPMTLLFLLHLLVVGLLAFALMRPAATNAWAGLGRRTEPTHLILLLDGSTSMAALDTPSGRSRFEDARTDVLARVSDLHEGDVATLILLGTHPTTMEATDAAGLKAMRDRLKQIAAPGGRADLNSALRLAQDLILPGVDDQIILFSDGALTVDPTLVESVGAPIELLRFGRPDTPNVAIADVQARGAPDNPDQDALYARIINFSDVPISADVVTYADNIEIERTPVEIAANDEVEQVVRQLPAGAREVTVSVFTNDTQQADNQASLVLPGSSDLGLRIALISDAPGALQRALAVLPGAQVTTVSSAESLSDSGEWATQGPFDLVVYEGFTPPDPAALPDAPMVFVNPPRNGLLPADATRTMLEPLVRRFVANDPLLSKVDLAGVTFGETPIHNLTATDTEIVGADDVDGSGSGALIYRGRIAATGQPMIVLTFDLNDPQTNLPQRIAFPILIVNIANELAPSPLPSALPLGDPLRYRPRADTATVRIVPPSGDAVELSVGAAQAADVAGGSVPGDSALLREVVYADTGVPGEYQITELDASGAESGGGTFVVNAGHGRESDLRSNQELPGVLATARPADETGTRTTLSDLWPALVMFALAVLSFEWLWAVLPRRRRRRKTAMMPGSVRSSA